MILNILLKGLVCPLITKSPAAERFSKDWPRSEASWGNVKFWSSTDFLVASTITLSIFYFVAVIELHAIKTTVILLYFKHPIKRKYFEVTNMKAILAVMNTTELVVKIRPEKNSGPYGIWAHDLWPMTSGLIFTTSSVVFISARIAFIIVSSTAVHIYMIFMYLQSSILYSLWSTTEYNTFLIYLANSYLIYNLT